MCVDILFLDMFQVYIRDSTMVSVYSLLLFGGGAISIDLDRGNFLLSVDDGWIRFVASSHQVSRARDVTSCFDMEAFDWKQVSLNM